MITLLENEFNNIFLFITFIFSLHLSLKFLYFNELEIWYLLHFVGNMYVVFVSLEPISLILNDPLYELFNPTEYYTTTIIVDIIHMYHILFFNISNDDLFHHLFFVGLGSFTVYYFQSGYYSALTHFFICGFPGGIDYLFLFLYKNGYIHKNIRLKVAMFLNVWIRSPGLCILSTFSIIKFIYSDKSFKNIFEFFLQLLNTLVNGQYYMQDVVYANGKYNT